MKLSDEQIIKVITDYVCEDRYKQAILIDGEWGSGKTHFVKKKLLNKLLDLQQADSQGNPQPVYYVSLYGLESTDQIAEEIYSASIVLLLQRKLNAGVSDKVTRGISISTKLFSIFLKQHSIDMKDLPTLNDIRPISRAVVIFDDLERCSVPLDTLLGYINNLVEHNDVKAIIVANEKEIRNEAVLEETHSKQIEKQNPSSKKSMHEISGKASSDSSELAAKSQYIESEGYSKVKEKLIGLTLKYSANLSEIFEDIVNQYVVANGAKQYLFENAELVLSSFEKHNHKNIRTLIFALLAFERFFEVVCKIHFEPRSYREAQIERLLLYIAEVAITIKTAKRIESWEDSKSQVGWIYRIHTGERVFGYKFIDNYLDTLYFDKEEVENTLLSVMKEEHQTDVLDAANSGLSYRKLRSWWDLEDEEAIEALAQTLEELNEFKYHPSNFKDMIVTLVQMILQEFHIDIVGETASSMIASMLECMMANDTEVHKDTLEAFSDDREFLKRYNALAAPLINYADKCEKEKRMATFSGLHCLWGESLFCFCEARNGDFLGSRGFFKYFSTDKLIEALYKSNAADVNVFIRTVNGIYSFSNLRTFFEEDAESLKEIIARLNSDEFSGGGVIKGMAIKRLKNKLEASLKILEG